MPRARLAANLAIAFARSAGAVAPLVVLAAMAGVAQSAIAQSFTLVGFPTPTVGEGTGRVYGLSADGQQAAGHSTGTGGTRGFQWTAGVGRNDFGLSLSQSTYGFGISGDGSTVVGATPGGQYHAYRWSASAGFQSLGTLPGYINSEARDASHDGSVVVGSVSNAEGSIPQAFRWTQSGGMQGLGVGTTATAISGDGSTIVGGTGPFGNRPFTWTTGTGTQFLQTLDGSNSGSANGVNHDGTIVVGESGSEFRGTIWINGVPQDLTAGSMTSNFNPSAVSDDGSIVAGQLNLGGGIVPAGVWTPSTGMIRLSDYLASNGVTIPAGISLVVAAVSADGRTFAGWTSNTSVGGIQGFVATISPPCPADLDNDGLLTNGGTRDRAVTIDDLLFFLAAFEAGNLAADLDNGSGTGTRDNAVTIEDLLYFLVHFEVGC